MIHFTCNLDFLRGGNTAVPEGKIQSINYLCLGVTQNTFLG